MKLLFVDEFKNNKKDSMFYGLVVALIDNSSYARFKKGFYDRLKKLGWDTKIEIKGRFSFSSTKGDKRIGVEDRLKFVETLFDLSKSSSNKYASAKVYYTLDVFPKSMSEMDMYSGLLYKILKKIPNGLKSGNKNGKNNVVIFLDSNDVLSIETISEQAEKILNSKNLFLIERCINFSSGNKTPGIIFADHIAYFIDNYLKTSAFNETNKEKIKLLISRFTDNSLSKAEQQELDNFMISFKKEQKSVGLLKALKKMTYVK